MSAGSRLLTTPLRRTIATPFPTARLLALPRRRSILLLILSITIVYFFWTSESWKWLDSAGSKLELKEGVLTVENASHPIHVLMDEAQKKWDAKVGRQSRSLRAAVAEYEKRYRRRPPHGFSEWYWFAKGKGFVLIDEFDLMEEKVKTFLALPSSILRERARKLQEDEEFWMYDKAFTVVMRDAGKHLSVAGPMEKRNERPEQMLELLSGIARYLPPMNLTVTGHDVPWVVMSGDKKDFYANKVETREGKEWTTHFPQAW